MNPKSSAAPASSLALSGAPVATMVAPADPADSGGLGSGDAKRRAENERSADALFESRSLDEIREVRARAARDAEAKDEELRQRVGSSYRDAIATADCVLEMETTAARATTTLDEAVRKGNISSCTENTHDMPHSYPQPGTGAVCGYLYR